MHPNPLPRFIKAKRDGFASAYNIRDTITHEEFPITPDVVIKRLNDLHEEKEFWKHATIQNDNENVILREELSIMMSQGAEPSPAFKEYSKLKAERVKEVFKDGLRIMGEQLDVKGVERINKSDEVK